MIQCCFLSEKWVAPEKWLRITEMSKAFSFSLTYDLVLKKKHRQTGFNLLNSINFVPDPKAFHYE